MICQTILIALGANLPDGAGRSALETCQWAMARLAETPGLRLVAASPWYRTRPVPVSDQPDYINGVIRLAGEAVPETLLDHLHGLESMAGRVRGDPNAARVLDLDLLGMDDLVVNSPVLTLPHPRLAERAFVLYPLCDVAPEWRHPVLGRRADELRREVDGSFVQLA